jgi:hypothetical protein
MIDLINHPLPCILLTLHCAIGVAAAIAAQRKGFPYGVWLVWGLIGGTAALVMALWLRAPAARETHH